VEQRVVELVVGDEDVHPAVEVIVRDSDAHAFAGWARMPDSADTSRKVPSPLFRNNWFGVGL